jgi:DNA-binding NtrC family response regulator
MKLLRVLETGRYERLGSNRERHAKVRVISATNADLQAMIRDGSFREDLYYRLNTVEIALPALAERPGDIGPLAEHFLAGEKPLSTQARDALQRHAWPGNVRELRNVLQRASLLAQGVRIEAGDLNLPRAAVSRPAAPATGEPDRARIEQALARAQGVIAQAAAELGLSRQALYRRMDRYGITSE